MARFLFVVPDFAGHINPTISVGAELSRRGHQVAWTGIPGLVNELLPDGCRFIPAAGGTEDMASSLSYRFRGLRSAAALKFLWFEALLPLARLMMEGVEAAAGEFRPDVMAVDQQALAGAVAARKRGLAWATLATTSAEIVDPLAGWPLVQAEIRRARVDLQLEAGLPASLAEEGDILFSPSLVVAFTVAALVGPAMSFPSHYHFVGPSTVDRVETVDFPWSWLDARRPAVFVSLGSINFQEGRRFLSVAAEALGSMPVQGIVVAPPGLVADPPGNVVVLPRVPQLAVLRRVSAVVCHGGHNTVCESLALGLPLVLAPIQNDQPMVAAQVTRAGCGIQVSFARAGVDEMREAIDRALGDPDLRRATGEVRRAFGAAPGPAGAADHLAKLASDT
ncbi:MAG: glycosyltransferase [Acidimicrobiales bacterium]